MEVLNRSLLHQFSRLHPFARSALSRWLEIAERSRWRNIVDVQKVFKSAEDVQGYVVFNIHGNHYRLITVIRFDKQQVYVHEVFTHAEYDRWSP